MTEELKGCPHCGASASGYAIEAHSHAMSIGEFRMPDHAGSYVIEGDCACGSGLIGETQEEVTARWNRRATPAPAQPEGVSMPQYWSVQVTADGEALVSIGNDWLSGERPLEKQDEQTIIGAAQHLLSFVGYGLPPLNFNPDDDEAAGAAAPAEGALATLLQYWDKLAASTATSEWEEAYRQSRANAARELRDVLGKKENAA